MKIQTKILFLLLHSLFFTGISAFANEIQPLQSLRQVAESFARDRATGASEVHAKALALDPRLRLPACQMPPTPFLPFGQNQTIGLMTIGVRCEDPQWSLYIPVQVDAFAPVVQVIRPVNRGALLTPNDVKLVKMNITRLNRGYFQNLDEVVGRQTRRALSVGEVVLPQLIRDQVLVQRGAEVMLTAIVGGAEVHTKGQALAEGQKGDVIDVLNKKSKRIVKGLVVDSGVVQAIKIP